MKDENRIDTSANPERELDLLWHPKNPALSEKLFRTILAELKDPAGADEAFRFELLTQIARAQAAQGKIEEAIVNLEAVTRFLESDPTEIPVRLSDRKSTRLNSSHT